MIRAAAKTAVSGGEGGHQPPAHFCGNEMLTHSRMPWFISALSRED